MIQSQVGPIQLVFFFELHVPPCVGGSAVRLFPLFSAPFVKEDGRRRARAVRAKRSMRGETGTLTKKDWPDHRRDAYPLFRECGMLSILPAPLPEARIERLHLAVQFGWRLGDDSTTRPVLPVDPTMPPTCAASSRTNSLICRLRWSNQLIGSDGCVYLFPSARVLRELAQLIPMIRRRGSAGVP